MKKFQHSGSKYVIICSVLIIIYFILNAYEHYQVKLEKQLQQNGTVCYHYLFIIRQSAALSHSLVAWYRKFVHVSC